MNVRVRFEFTFQADELIQPETAMRRLIDGIDDKQTRMACKLCMSLQTAKQFGEAMTPAELITDLPREVAGVLELLAQEHQGSALLAN